MLRDAELPGHQPIGVCGQVIPWKTSPLLNAGVEDRDVALAAGNTVVLKPAEDTIPHGASFSAKICQEAGLPVASSNNRHGDRTHGRGHR